MLLSQGYPWNNDFPQKREGSESEQLAGASNKVRVLGTSPRAYA